MLLHGCKACLLAIVQLAAISGTLGVTAPYFIEEPSDIYVRKGKSAVLNCRVAGDPKPSIKWKRNGVTLTLDSRRTIKPDGSLYFSEIIHNKTQKPDEGTYQCEAVSYISVDYSIISRTARVIVAGISSKVVVTPSSLRSTVGDTAQLLCSIKHSIPKALFAWRKQGSNITITTGSHYTLTPDGALQIRNIRFEDQGKYECIAANPEIMRQHTSTNAATLQVGPDRGFPRQPYFETSPKDTLAISGNKVVFECIANGDPKPRVTWLKDGSPIQLGSHGYSILGESNLVIQFVSVEHAGVYTCHATALTRFKEATAKLDVHYGPVFTKKPSVLHAYRNTNARFECRADGMPKPNITWAKNGEELSKTSDFIDIGDGYLVVYDLVLSDKGAYQCFAKNSLGTIQATAELSVYRKGEPLPTTTPTPTPTTQEPTTTVITTSRPTIPTRRVPEKPENVVATALSDTEIKLSWSPPTVTNGKIVEYSCIFYEVDQEGAFVGPVGQVNTSGDENRIVISNLKPNTNYHFSVFAHNKNGAGSLSDKAVAETYPISQVPGPPRNLVAEAESDSTIRVTWAVPATGSVYRYIIIYKDTSSNSGNMRDVTKQQTRVLRDLKTYTKYTITVYAETQKGLKGKSAVTEATTKGGVPRVAPTDFALKPDSSGTGLISTWKAPDPTKVNGRITFYTIKYRKAGSTDESTTERIGADKLAYVIKGLMPRTRYQAKIAAGTESGLGEYTKDWVEASTNVTNCTEDKNPGKPTFDSIDRFPEAILVRWLPPDNAGVVCVTQYHLAWGKNAPYQSTSKPLSSDETQYVIKDLLPDQNYVIKLWASNSKYVGVDIQEPVKTLSKPGPSEPVKSVKAVPLSSSEMQISWRDPKVSLSAPVVYHVYSKRNQLKYCGNTTAKSIKCTQLKPKSKYLFYVRRNEEGINATVSNITMEDKPGVPMDLTGNPNEQDLTRLTLQWQPPLEHKGDILAYRIYYSMNGSASHEKWNSVEADGSSLTKEISGLKPGTAYYFKIQARTKKGWGPLTSEIKVSTLSTAVTGIPRSKDPSGTGLSSPVPTGPNAAAQAGGPGLKNKTLWIIIAAVAGVTLIAIIIISVILCKKRSGDDIQRKPPTYKQVIQANGSTKKKHKEEKTPDLWINHTDDIQMKPVESVNPAPDVTNTTALIPKSSNDMKPLEDSPLDHMHIDHERSSFLNGSEADPDDFADLPPPPMIDSKDDPYLDYPDDNRTPTPPPSPGVSPFNPPRPVTPENGKQPMYPVTSTPNRYPMGLPRTGSYENTLDVADPRPPQRSRSYDPDFTSPTTKMPVYPMLHQSPAHRPILPKPKPPVAPADDIQLPPVGYNRKKPPNGYWAPPPRYEDIFARRSNPPTSPQREQQDPVVADLDKEIAGLEGLMRDLNEITAGDYII